MPTTSWPAQGTTVGIAETNTATYALINLITTFGQAGGGTVGERDTTVLASTVHTNAPTIPDNGEFTISLLFDPTDTVHMFVRALKDVPYTAGFNNIKVTYNDGGTPSTDVFGAWVKEFDGINGDDVDASLTADVTFRVTGAVTHT
jgi:hypothetical protein